MCYILTYVSLILLGVTWLFEEVDQENKILDGQTIWSWSGSRVSTQGNCKGHIGRKGCITTGFMGGVSKRACLWSSSCRGNGYSSSKCSFKMRISD